MNIEDDEVYWQSLETPPIGFLEPGEGYKNLKLAIKGESILPSYRERIREELKNVMFNLESKRWTEIDNFPSDEEFDEVIDYLFYGLVVPLIKNQNEMFSNVDPQSDESLMKAYSCGKKQNQIMEKFAAFSKPRASQ